MINMAEHVKHKGFEDAVKQLASKIRDKHGREYGESMAYDIPESLQNDSELYALFKKCLKEYINIESDKMVDNPEQYRMGDLYGIDRIEGIEKIRKQTYEHI